MRCARSKGARWRGLEWRVHCHVPIFLDDLGAFSSTQPFVREVLQAPAPQTHLHAPGSGDLHLGRAAAAGCAPTTWIRPSRARSPGRATSWNGAEAVQVTAAVSVAVKLGRISNLPTVWTNTLVGVTLAGASLDAIRACRCCWWPCRCSTSAACTSTTPSTASSMPARARTVRSRRVRSAHRPYSLPASACSPPGWYCWRSPDSASRAAPAGGRSPPGRRSPRPSSCTTRTTRTTR